MYYVQDAHSFWDWIYFVLLIVIGSFFMINLCLVVIATQFSETKKREMERMKMERARFQSTSTLASGSTSEPNSCYAEIIKYIAHLWRRGKRKFYIRYKQFRRRNKSDHPHQLSLKKQRRRRQYEAAQSAIISREGGASGVPSTVVAMAPTVGGIGPGGALTVMNNISSTSPQLLSPPEVHEVPDDSRNNNAPRISPEFSDIDPQASTHRPVLLKISSGTSGDGSNELLPPSPGGQGTCTPQQHRRSSVTFSDVVLLHGHAGETATKNVCHSEKTTQTDDEPLDPSYFREPLPHHLTHQDHLLLCPLLYYPQPSYPLTRINLPCVLSREHPQIMVQGEKVLSLVENYWHLVVLFLLLCPHTWALTPVPSTHFILHWPKESNTFQHQLYSFLLIKPLQVSQITIQSLIPVTQSLTGVMKIGRMRGQNSLL